MRSIKLPSWISRALGAGARSTPPFVFAFEDDVLSYARFGIVSDRDTLRIEESRQWAVPPELFGKGPIGGPIRDQAALDAFVKSAIDELEAPVQEASLVLPDDWSRAVFVEVAELPKNDRARDEILRWKLKQQLPFRVEDLRVRGAAVQPLKDQSEPQRLLATFGSEHLLSGLESAFQRAGIRIGHLGGRSIAFAEGASRQEGGEVFLWSGTAGYSVVVLGQGDPVMLRSKTLEPGLDPYVVAGMVERELRLTLGFLAKKNPGLILERVVVGADERSLDWVDVVNQAISGMLGSVPLGDSDARMPVVSAASDATQDRFELGTPGIEAPVPTAWLPLFGAAQRAVA